MSEPIVSRDRIRGLARAAADAGNAQHQANPYPHDSAASLHWEHDYVERMHELEAEESVV